MTRSLVWNSQLLVGFEYKKIKSSVAFAQIFQISTYTKQRSP